jgi:hypothetical protein
MTNLDCDVMTNVRGGQGDGSPLNDAVHNSARVIEKSARHPITGARCFVDSVHDVIAMPFGGSMWTPECWNDLLRR